MKRLLYLVAGLTIFGNVRADDSNAEVNEFQLDPSIKAAARNEALNEMKRMSKNGLADWRKDTDLDHPLYSAILITKQPEHECEPGPGRYVIVLFNSLKGKPYPTHMVYKLLPTQGLQSVGSGFGGLMSSVIDELRDGDFTCD